MIHFFGKHFLLFVLLLSPVLIFKQNEKRVLIIGDSISIGYFPFVKAALNGIAVVEHNAGNAAHTGIGLSKLQEWLKGEHWDVIHFNWGLWDLCYRHPDAKAYGNRDKINGKIQFTPGQYETNMIALVNLLKGTGAKLIFATTTVIPSNEVGRFAGDEKKYNKIAVRIMKENGIMVDDLNVISKDIHAKFGVGDDDVHFQKEGYKMLAKSVSESIKKAVQDSK